MLRAALNWRLYRLQQAGWKTLWSLRRRLDATAKVHPEKISLVVVGRNDNYGGDFSLRLRTTLDWNMMQLPGAELIYVEWNPVAGRPSDCEWISKRYSNAKCYIVPPEIHRMVSGNPDKLPVMEYFAKNLGIRKTTSDWVLLVNADVLVAPDTVRLLDRLSPQAVYGTHYVSFRWDGQPIAQRHFEEPQTVTVSFAAGRTIQSVAGNFILTHKNNWMKATGYDEKLVHSRAGVDSNGVLQLLYHGVRQQVLGHHYHLDHPESIVNASQASHGDMTLMRAGANIPYQNPPGWGLSEYPLKKIGESIWELQKT